RGRVERRRGTPARELERELERLVVAGAAPAHEHGDLLALRAKQSEIAQRLALEGRARTLARARDAYRDRARDDGHRVRDERGSREVEQLVAARPGEDDPSLREDGRELELAP